MNAQLTGMLLPAVVLWPLLLAIPALHARVPSPRHLALLPAVLLAMVPGDASIALPRVLFGTGLAFDNDVRGLLAMTVAIGFAAATVARAERPASASSREPLFFLLTLAGTLGVVLAADVVAFFALSTLMGYGFYGLLLQAGDDAARRAGRLYIVCLVAADLALFEALLLAASTTADLRFASVRSAMQTADAAQLYFWMTLVAFALKAGVWPLHGWLAAALRVARRSTVFLLGGVPVAMGMLGALRWLPLGARDPGVADVVVVVLGAGVVLAVAFAMGRRWWRAGAGVSGYERVDALVLALTQALRGYAARAADRLFELRAVPRRLRANAQSHLIGLRAYLRPGIWLTAITAFLLVGLLSAWLAR